MASKCKECGNEENYNFALNIGLCDSCIYEKVERAEQLQADLALEKAEHVCTAISRDAHITENKRLKEMLDEFFKSKQYWIAIDILKHKYQAMPERKEDDL